MERLEINLTAEQLAELDRRFPRGRASGNIGQRAMELVRIHLSATYPGVQLIQPPRGADLAAHVPGMGRDLVLEVKGTDSDGVAWSKLKVSSVDSHRLLSEEQIPLYRVTRVFEPSPVIFVLRCGEDFELTPELRWAARPLRGTGRAQATAVSKSSVLEMPAGQARAPGRASKYAPLGDYLASLPEETDEVTLTFQQIEALLGSKLPESAYRYPAFWANQSDTHNRPHAREWQRVGFIVDAFHADRESGWVRLKRR